MESPQGRRARGQAAEELILRTVAAHADSLLRTARRYSLCPDDAQDAYQRALEIFMAHADRLDGSNAAGWLHVVVKREAHAIRSSRQRLVGANEVDLDAHEAQLPTSDERLATFDLVGRAAEALQRLKPQELRALWLKAEGHSYNEICALTGWSYTNAPRTRSRSITRRRAAGGSSWRAPPCATSDTLWQHRGQLVCALGARRCADGCPAAGVAARPTLVNWILRDRPSAT